MAKKKAVERRVSRTKGGTGWVLEKIFVPKERFRRAAMISTLTGKRSTFVSRKPRPGVWLIIGCLPKNFDAKRGICLRTTLHKQITQITPAEARRLRGVRAPAKKVRKIRKVRVPAKKKVRKAATRKPVRKARKAAGKPRKARKVTGRPRKPRKVRKARKTARKGRNGNPQLLVISNPCPRPCPKATFPASPREVARTNRAYKRFHFTKPAVRMTADVPRGFPSAYMVIGELERFDTRTPTGRVVSRKYAPGSPRPVLCTTSAMKDLYIFDARRLGIPAGTAKRCDYRVPAHSGRNKWARRFWHPHDTTPGVCPHGAGKAVRVSGRGLSVRPEGIVG